MRRHPGDAVLVLCLGVVAAAVLSTPAHAQDRTLRVQQVAPGVHVVMSSYLGDANVLVVDGGDELLLVDVPMPPMVDDMLALAPGADRLPIRNVVLTHWHPDHTIGIAQLRVPGMTFRAHENAAARMRSGGPIGFFGADIPPYEPRALADSVIREPRVLRVGERDVHLVPMPPAHTDGDVVVHLRDANVVHMGDLAMGSFYPFVELSSGGDVHGLLAVLDRALELTDDETVIVPGHGPLMRRADLVEFREVLATAWQRVREGVAAGQSLEQVVASRPAAEYEARWNSPVIPTEGFVGILFQAASAPASP